MRVEKVVYKNGEDAHNLVGSCVVLAIASAVGMKYEDATNWVRKNMAVAGIKKVGGFEHVAGVYTYANTIETFRKLRKNAVVTRYNKIDAEIASHYEDPAKEMAWRCSLNNVDRIEGKRMKVATFAKKNPRGRHILQVQGHALACVHGQIFDNGAISTTYKNAIVRQSISL